MSVDLLLFYKAIIPKTKPIGYSNDMMASAPKSEFFKRVIKALSHWNHWYLFPYLTVFFSTGPMFLSIQYWLSDKDGIGVLSPCLYSECKTKLFKHYEGSSWHSWDAEIIKWGWNNTFTFSVFVCLLFLIGTLFIKKMRSEYVILPIFKNPVFQIKSSSC
jgi:mannosyltransferase OCH1-like enzyme